MKPSATRRRSHRLKSIAATLCAASFPGIAGCTVGPEYKRPVAEVPPAYKEAADWKMAEPNDQNLGGTWWTIFQDSQLNELEEKINVSNQSLKAAEEQYTQARAMLRYTRAAYYPQVDGAAAVSRNRISDNRPPGLRSNGVTATSKSRWRCPTKSMFGDASGRRSSPSGARRRQPPPI